MELLNSCRSAGGISWLCAVNHVALSPLHRAKLTISMLEDSRKRCYFAARRQTTCCTLFPVECNTGYGERGKAGKTRMPARREAPDQESGALGPVESRRSTYSAKQSLATKTVLRATLRTVRSCCSVFTCFAGRLGQRQPTASCKRAQGKETKKKNWLSHQVLLLIDIMACKFFSAASSGSDKSQIGRAHV